MFRAPGSSDPPSTPDRRSNSPHISTTPAGPPPPSSRPWSFTPAGHPPSSTFVSPASKTGPAKPLFPSRTANTSALSNAEHLPSKGFASGHAYRIPDSSPPQLSDMDAEGSEDDDAAGRANQMSPEFPDLQSSAFEADLSPLRNKRKRNALPDVHASRIESESQYGGVDIRGFAKGIAASMPPAELDESDDFILEVNHVLQTLDRQKTRDPESGIAAVESTARLLKEYWGVVGSLDSDDVQSENIGPTDGTAIQKANFLASLVFAIFYPSGSRRKADSAPAFKRQSLRRSVVLHPSRDNTPVPRVLLDWLAEYHNPSGEVADALLESQGSITLRPSFWDSLYSMLVRGRLDVALEMLQRAKTRDQDLGYTGAQMDHVQQGFNIVANLIAGCPALTSQDWDVKGPDWAVFRHRTTVAKKQLQTLLRGNEDGLDRSIRSKSKITRNAGSCLPMDMYEYLDDITAILLGDAGSIVKSCYTWAEAAIALTVWWDGEEDDVMHGSMSASRRSLSRSQHTRTVDLTPTIAYRQRLAEAFVQAMGEEDLADAFDSTNALEIGMACICVGYVEGFLSIMRGWSLCMASALAEIGSVGGWLPNSGSARHQVNGFDQGDLMVLDYGQDRVEVSLKDEILSTYATLLAQREMLQQSSRKGSDVEGWQLALITLGKLNDSTLASSKVSALLDGLNLTSTVQVDELLDLCNRFGFSEQAIVVAEKFADRLADSGTRYGDSLLYLARAHKPQKLKELVDRLTRLSLVQSLAFPPASQLDPRLASLLESPGDAHACINAADMDARRYLLFYLSGYAAVRRFYEFRDAKTVGETGEQAMARKTAAAEALVGAVKSAADCIKGGLFDPGVEMVVHVDNLVVLLGEALPLLSQSAPYFTEPQLLALLSATESLDSLPNRSIPKRCARVLRAALANAHDPNRPVPRSLVDSTASLTRGGSSGAGSSQFSLIEGSTMLGSHSGDFDEDEGSAVLVRGEEPKRAWDWRAGVGRGTSLEEVLGLLRLMVMEEMARVWVR